MTGLGAAHNRPEGTGAKSGRVLMAVGSLLRLTYGFGVLFTPETMRAVRLVPYQPGYFGMTTRGFGALHANLALMTVRSAVLDRDTRFGLRLNIGCDLTDLLATVLEWREGELPTGALLGSAAVQSAFVAIWTAAMRRI